MVGGDATTRGIRPARRRFQRRWCCRGSTQSATARSAGRTRTASAGTCSPRRPGRCAPAGRGAGPLKAERVYASGWSFTGSFLRTFINGGFHDRARDARGRPLIDGYLIGISSSSFRSGYVPINAHTPNLEPEDPRRQNRAIGAPVIQLMSENEAITNREPQTPERRPRPPHRLLREVPGLTHGSGGGTRRLT